MQKPIIMNPFDEVFDTNTALDYINAHADKLDKQTYKRTDGIAHITLKKAKLGRLLNPRCRIYLKPELDAFIAGEDYIPDPAYESAVLDQLLLSKDVVEQLGMSYSNLKKIMSFGKIQYELRGKTAVFIQQFIDDYQEKQS